MAGRIRTIKPEWLEDERLRSVSIEARLLSVALLLLADDYGHGRALYDVIGVQVFPGVDDPRDYAEAAMAELVQIGFVVLYRVRDQAYFEIRNWEKHQRVTNPGKPRVPFPETPTQTHFLEIPTRNSESLARNSEDLEIPRNSSSLITDHRSPITDPDHRPAGAGGGGPDVGEVEARLAASKAFKGADVVGAAFSIHDQAAQKGITHARVMQVLPWALSLLEDAMMRPDPPRNPAKYVRTIVLKYGPPGCYERRDEGQRSTPMGPSSPERQTGGKLAVYVEPPEDETPDQRRARAKAVADAARAIGMGGRPFTPPKAQGDPVAGAGGAIPEATDAGGMP